MTDLAPRFKWVVGSIEKRLGAQLALVLPQTVLRAVVSQLPERDPQVLLEALGPYLSGKPDLDNMPFDLPTGDELRFEHLAGLFSSTALDHAVVAMTIRQAAYLYGLVRQMPARKVIEIGRYKGGSTLIIAAAMGGEGQFWSIDVGEKENRMHSGKTTRSFDDQIRDVCNRFALQAQLIVGDSRTVEIDTGQVDLVLIEGDHSWEGTKNDFERFGRRVRVCGAVLLDDVCGDGMFESQSTGPRRIVDEIVAGEEFRLVKTVNRMAHLERV